MGFFSSLRTSFNNIFNDIDSSESNKSIKKPTERKMRYHRIFNVAGVTYKCRLDKYYKRQYAIDKTKYKDTFHLEEYKYKGEPAFLIVNDRLQLDIGTIPAFLVERVKKYEDSEFETAILLEDIDEFDSYNDSGSKKRHIVYVKMLYAVYSDKQ